MVFQSMIFPRTLSVMMRVVHSLSLVAHESKDNNSSQHQRGSILVGSASACLTETWWLVDSGASIHLMNEETLRGVRVVSQSDHAGSDCVTATGDSVGISKKAVVQVHFRLVSGETVLVELEVLVAPVKFNLLSLQRILERGWPVSFQPQFEVSASSSGQVFQLIRKWQTNCGWVSSSKLCLQEQKAPCTFCAVPAA